MTDYASWYDCPTDASREDCPSSCAFSIGADLIPDHGFCAPMNITQNVTAIVDCSRADKEQCGDYWHRYQCRWRRGKDVANNTQFDYGKLFESNFCHAPTYEGFGKDFSRCANNTDEQSCSMNDCMWSTAREWIQGNSSFCSLEYISLNMADYESCSRNESDCYGQCRWYNNKENGNNSNPLDRTELFTKEFCHPRAGTNMTKSNWDRCPTDASRWECPT